MPVVVLVIGTLIVVAGGIIYANDPSGSSHLDSQLSIFMWAVGGLLGSMAALVGVIYFALSKRVDKLAEAMVGTTLHKSEMAAHTNEIKHLQAEIESKDAEIDEIWKELRQHLPQEIIRSVNDLRLQVGVIERDTQAILAMIRKA